MANRYIVDELRMFEPLPPLVVQDTEADLRAIQDSLAAAEKRLLKRGVEVPQWMLDAGLPIKWNSYKQKWCIQFKVRSYITEVLYDDVWVHHPQGSKPFTVRLWVPLDKDGAYQVSGIHLDDGSLPHITQAMACLGLGDAPPKLTSTKECQMLMGSLVRGLKQINLSSLLSREKMRWLKEVRDAVPSEVRRRIGLRRMGRLPQGVLDKYFTRLAIGDEEETWHANDV